MGTRTEVRQFDRARPIVAFDFDGTLTVRDSFLSFLRYKAGAFAYALGLIRLAPALIAYVFDRDRGRLKTAAATIFLKGLSAPDLDASAERFAASAAAGLFRPDAEQRWRDWQSKGAVMCIVTASPEHTVAPFARRLGADVLIGTQLEVDGSDRLTGRFTSENCRAQAKVDRLRARFGEDMVLAAAYGDTTGDTEMLAMAQEAGFRVFTGRP